MKHHSLTDYMSDAGIAKRRAWYEATREQRRAANLATKRKTRAGFDPALVALAFSLQSRQCAICRCDLDALPSHAVHADHCHVTGKPRGILCRHCNFIIGHARDSVETLRAAIDYLQFPTLSVSDNSGPKGAVKRQ